MLTLQMIACIGMIVGAFLLLGIRINDFTGNIFRKLLNKLVKKPFCTSVHVFSRNLAVVV